jgi:hypothetical protein
MTARLLLLPVAPHRARPTFVRSALALIACVLVFAFTSRATAQSTSWTSAHQQATWLSTFVDHAITPRDALWFDGHWRRMGFGESPQQLLLRGGVLHTIAPGVRVGGGYAYIATAPYGDVPIAAPLREHRIWQQLTLGHKAGAVSFVHRYRFEQRWLASVRADASGDGSTLGPWAYQQRARYQIRGQGNLPAMRLRGRPLLAFAYDELLMPIGHADATLRVTQNRLGGGIGIPVDARQRIELGYMNLWNAIPARRANEINHTLTVSWVWTATK